MQKKITRKADVAPIVEKLKPFYRKGDHPAFYNLLKNELLQHRVKFPLLEFVAIQLFESIPYPEQTTFTHQVMEMDLEGGNVVVGKILQLRLPTDLPEAFVLASKYMVRGDTWYVCDIIGERVYGHGLLTKFETAWPLLHVNENHSSNWVVRSIGVGIHYAIKKGLEKAYIPTLMDWLLSMSGNTDYQIKRGVGWAAKTLARFHPELVIKNRYRFEAKEVGTWFQTKVKTGLKYAGYGT